MTEDFIRNFREVMSYDIHDFDEWLKLPPAIADKRDHIHGLLAYICVVINKGLIDINLVDDIIAVRVIQYWEKSAPFILEWRTRFNDPTGGDDLEQAYRKLKQRRDRYIALARQRHAMVNP